MLDFMMNVFLLLGLLFTLWWGVMSLVLAIYEEDGWLLLIWFGGVMGTGSVILTIGCLLRSDESLFKWVAVPFLVYNLAQSVFFHAGYIYNFVLIKRSRLDVVGLGVVLFFFLLTPQIRFAMSLMILTNYSWLAQGVWAYTSLLISWSICSFAYLMINEHLSLKHKLLKWLQ